MFADWRCCILPYAREWYMDESDIPETAQVFGTPVGRVYFTDIFQMDVYDEIGNFDKNVLIVHGSDDSIVPISYSERAVEVYPSAELIVMDGARHGFSGVDQEEAAIDIVGFLQQNTPQPTMKLQKEVEKLHAENSIYIDVIGCFEHHGLLRCRCPIRNFSSGKHRLRSRHHT